MMIRKRSWKGPDGKRKSSYFMDYIDPLTGERRREVLKGITSKEHANMVASAKFTDYCLRANMGVAAPPSEFERSLTLGRLMDLDIERSGISPTTVRSETEHGKALRRLLGENTPIMAITTIEVERFKTLRQKEGKARTVNIGLELLRAMLNRAKARHIISRVPCVIKELAEEPVKRRFLSPEEINALVAKAEGNLKDVVFLMSSLGIKPCEVWRLTWQDVDFKSGLLWVTTHKRGDTAIMRREPVPMIPALEAMFKRKLSEAADRGQKSPVFTERIGDRAVKHLAKRAGLDHPEQVTAYTLRHSFATNLLLSGASIKDTQALMRHRDPALTLRVYAQESMPSMRVAVERIGQIKAHVRHKEIKADSDSSS